MAITVTRSEDGQETAAETFNGNKRVRDYTLVWRAVATANESAFDVKYSDELFYEVDVIHPDDSSARIVGLTVDKEKGGAVRSYICTATYSSDKDKGNRNPIYPDTAADISYQWQERMVPVDQDLDGEALVNTAGDALDPPKEINIPILIKTIKVGLDPSDALTYLSPSFSRAVNSGTYDGWEPGQVLLSECDVVPATYTDDADDEIEYSEVTIRLTFDCLGHNPVKVLNAGYNELDADTGEKKRILMPKDGSEATNLIPLDEDGYALHGVDAVEAGKHYLEFNLYNSVSFSPFNF